MVRDMFQQTNQKHIAPKNERPIWPQKDGLIDSTLWFFKGPETSY